MELRVYKRRKYTATVYLAPAVRPAAWWQKDPRWKHGFVVRLLWLGFVVRWGHKPTLDDLMWSAMDKENWTADQLAAIFNEEPH